MSAATGSPACAGCGSTDRSLDANFHCSTCYADLQARVEDSRNAALLLGALVRQHGGTLYLAQRYLVESDGVEVETDAVHGELILRVPRAPAPPFVADSYYCAACGKDWVAHDATQARCLGCGRPGTALHSADRQH